MLKIQEIREIIKLIDQSNIDEFSYEHEGSKIELKKKSFGEVVVSPTFQQVPKKVIEEVKPTVTEKVSAVEVGTINEVTKKDEITNVHKITSPMVGTFYSSPSPDTDNYVSVGSKVSNKTIVCIVEAMKLFNEIEAEIEGEIIEILVKDGQLVEYGQPLFLVKPI